MTYDIIKTNAILNSFNRLPMSHLKYVYHLNNLIDNILFLSAKINYILIFIFLRVGV